MPSETNLYRLCNFQILGHVAIPRLLQSFLLCFRHVTACQNVVLQVCYMLENPLRAILVNLYSGRSHVEYNLKCINGQSIIVAEVVSVVLIDEATGDVLPA